MNEETIYAVILKLFIIALLLAVVISALWYSSDFRSEFKPYRKSKGGKWFKYKIDDVEFWSDDWTLPHIMIDYEEY